MADAIRLQKYLSGAGVASRRTAEEMIRAGQVKVNGKVVTELGTRMDPDVDVVEVDRVRIRRSAPVWIALHKPVGYVTTRKDPEGRKTVYDLLPPEYHGLFYVGRLDVNSEGLLLLTNQGEVANQLTHPSYEVDRVYKAVVKGVVNQATARRLMQGVKLEDGIAKAHSVHIDGGAPEGYTRLKLTLREGKNREARRLLKEVGHPVTRLMRVRYGPIKLEGLEPGAWRRLGVAERAELSSGSAGSEARHAKQKGRAQRVHREARAGQQAGRGPGARGSARKLERAPRREGRPKAKTEGRTEAPKRPRTDDRPERRPPGGDRPDRPAKPRSQDDRAERSGARERKPREEKEPRRTAKPEATGRGGKRKTGPPSGPQPRGPRGAKSGGKNGPPPKKPRRGPGSRQPRA
jgi:23S rRNA pseudouridine2605 synthase